MRKKTKKDKKFILWLKELSKKDIPLVGGKNASLAEMFNQLSGAGVRVPDGFAFTTLAYWHFLKENKGFEEKLKKIFSQFNPKSIKNLQVTGKKARNLILKGKFPLDLKEAIEKAYEEMEKKYGKNCEVAVRSSGVAEDAPSISKDEPVLVKLNGEIIYTPVEKLYKRWEELSLEKRKLFVPSLQGNKIKWYRVKELYRHPVKDTKLVKILTKSGRKITITPNHSLVFLNPDNFELRVGGIKDINKETRIPVIKKIPLKIKKRNSIIDVRKIIKSEPLLIENGRVKIKEGLWKKQKSFPCEIKVDKDFAYFLGIYVAEGSTSDKNCIDISCESEQIANKVKKYLKRAFGLSSSLDKKNARVFSRPFVVILHELVGFPLEKKGKGRFARTKRVPDLIFNQNEKIISEFLKGCFDGDGYVSKDGIEYSTVSPNLLGGIIKLLEILGIKCWITKPDTLTIPISEGREFFKKIGLTEKKNIQKLKSFLKEYDKREKHYDFIDNFPPSKKISELLEKELKPELNLEKTVVKVCPKCRNPMRKFGTARDYKNKDIRYQRYYCKNCKFYPTERTTLSLRNKMFLKYINYDENGHFKKRTVPWNKGNRKMLLTYGASYLKKIAKKIKSKELLKITNSDVIWDRIEKIEPIKYSGHVYDFVVPKTQNFAAGLGGIITHNTMSFAGQFETFLNVRGKEKLLTAVKKCLASSFNDRVIAYREEKKIDHLEFALSVGVQKMVRSDLASSGVIFTLDTETGFPDVVLINSIWGVGEMIVQGKVTPDEFYVHKPTFKKGFKSIILKNLGSKTKKYIFAKGSGLKEVPVAKREQLKFSLTDEEILTLAKWAITIEEHYGKAQDIEWAKDGKTGELFIVQSRPETVHTQKVRQAYYREYKIKSSKMPVLTGTAIGEKIGQGKVRVIPDVSQITQFKKGEVLVTKMTDPDWLPIFPLASAIITEEGGATCHAAIVSRELGVPCIVGAKEATKILKTGQEITADCSGGRKGKIFLGKIPFKVKRYDFKKVPKLKTKIMVNIGAPEIAFKASFLPVDGVGLAREEFIIAEKIRVHPLALYHYKKLKAKNKKFKTRAKNLKLNLNNIVKQTEEITVEHKDKKEFFIKELAEGIAQIAAAFYPREVIVRFSDFKSNEYENLVGGQLFEKKEENPMMGFRGASRYLDKEFEPAFKMECQAIKRARDVFGLKNISLMIPFCRTVEEGKKVLRLMKKFGLEKGRDNLEVYVMAEIPSNVVLANEFLEIFDGYSIGSNDLTQLVLGVDRDNAQIAYIGDERNEAVKEMIKKIIKTCQKKKKYSGICGQAPSDFPEFAEFLVKEGIESISLNPDTVIKTILDLSKIKK